MSFATYDNPKKSSGNGILGPYPPPPNPLLKREPLAAQFLKPATLFLHGDPNVDVVDQDLVFLRSKQGDGIGVLWSTLR